MAKQDKKYFGEIELDNFLSLPRRAQHLFFEYLLSGMATRGKEAYRCFDVIDFACRGCESPIEKIFYLAYQYVTFWMDEEVDLAFYRYALIPQYDVHSNGKLYRADFVFDSSENSAPDIAYAKDFKLIVECDGHDFHKITKDQVVKDNDRDFDLKSAGYDVLHFSGTQIYQNPTECALKVLKYIMKKVGDK